jgi:hypothetical protein
LKETLKGLGEIKEDESQREYLYCTKKVDENRIRQSIINSADKTQSLVIRIIRVYEYWENPVLPITRQICA